jgi:twitching motility protein PilI
MSAPAARVSLRDYQLALSERLQSAQAEVRAASKLGLLAAGESWLVALEEASEVLPVHAITPVPLAQPWFRGVANVRGNLYSVTDFSAFAGEKPTAMSEQARLLIVAERFRVGAALLVERSLGLRPAESLKPHAGGTAQPWVRAQFVDAEGTVWKELDVAALVQNESFLEVSV